MKVKTAILLLVFLIVFIPNVRAQQTINFDDLLQKTISAYQNVHDYTCVFHKKELVGGKLREERNIFFKFMKPQHFYMKWTEGGNKGVESIYVKGKYKDKLVVHLGGILSFLDFSIDPYGKIAMRNNRHPMTEGGLGHIINLIEKNYLMSKDDKDSVITYQGEKDLDGIKTIFVKTVFPEGKGYYGHIIYIYFDKLTYLPVKVTTYGWKNELLEDYQFDNVKLNVGLTSKDFDKNNPEYHF